MSTQTSSGNEGLSNLQRLVRRIESRTERKKEVPLVLVSGFSGWGEALFGTFNYWGGFEDLPAALKAAGYNVIVVRIGPLSSNWERACEVFAQLNSSKFDLPNEPAGEKIDVDYGTTYPTRYGYRPLSHTKKAVLYGELPSGWKWSQNNPVHFIAHSQGGTTIRNLITLMTGDYHEDHPEYFAEPGRQNWIKSLVTLGTPHKGTTVTDVVSNLLPPNSLEILTQLIVSVSFKVERFYDLQLEHWGFSRLILDPLGHPRVPETFLEMQTRIAPAVQIWWEGVATFDPPNGFFDNSIEGMAKLNEFTAIPSPDTYYFTMSFNATVDFPNETLTPSDLSSFPFPLSNVPIFRPFTSIAGWIGATSISLGSRLAVVPNIVPIARWFVKVLNRHLGARNYFNKIPLPGPKVPRSDMLPALLVTSIGMGGWEGRVAAGYSSKDFQPNDGIVNTISMRGPNEELVSDRPFPVERLGSVEGALSAERVKGVYWHLGINHTMDHGDQIGVFTVGQTYREVERMYTLLAQLLSRLP